MSKKVIIIFVIVFLCLSLLLVIGLKLFSPPDESYLFEKSPSKLKGSVEYFKEKNPQYKVIYKDKDGVEQERKDGYTGNFYYCYFRVHGEIYRCRISDVTKNKTRLYLVSVGGSDINTYQIPSEENKRFKILFEDEVLDKLGEWKHYTMLRAIFFFD